MQPINLAKWIDSHRELLKPPVGNRCVFDEGDFIVMVVGGPNSRSDYHVNQGEELFYQIEGDMTLNVIEHGQRKAIAIAQGDLFLLPKGVPHSPQRPANTVGLVIEQKRKPSEQDGFHWYCKHCDEKLFEHYEHIEDIETQLPPIFDRFYQNPAHTQCSECGEITQ